MLPFVLDYGVLAMTGVAALAMILGCQGALMRLGVVALALLLLPLVFFSSDWHMAAVLPHISPMGEAEPFAEYFLLYFPLSVCIAVLLAAGAVRLFGVVVTGRRARGRPATMPPNSLRRFSRDAHS
jgi:hypothetical protein